MLALIVGNTLHHRWARLLVPGFALNWTVIVVNGGMPVIPRLWPHGDPPSVLHHLATASDRLPWLWDRFTPLGCSAGDFLIAAGAALYMGKLVQESWRRRDG